MSSYRSNDTAEDWLNQSVLGGMEGNKSTGCEFPQVAVLDQWPSLKGTCSCRQQVKENHHLEGGFGWICDGFSNV